MKKERLERMRDSLPGEELLRKPITRRGLLAGAGATSFALLLAACGGDDEEAAPGAAGRATRGAAGDHRVPAGDDRAGSSGTAVGGGAAEGRARRGHVRRPGRLHRSRALPVSARLGGGTRDLGAAPAAPGRRRARHPHHPGAQLRPAAVREPVARGRPVVRRSCSRRRPGSRSSSSRPTPADEYQENLRNASTQNGSFDIVTSAIEETGDFAEAGLILPLDEYVDKYQPSWLDPEFGYAGGEATVALFNKYKDSYYFVAFDNDTQPYFYRSDLLENPEEQAAFEDQYGRPLEFPLTWEHHDEVAAFFTRPDADIPLFGDANTLAPFWCAVKWNERFVSSANPNMYYFNEDGVGQRQQRGRRPRLRGAAGARSRSSRPEHARAGLDRPVPGRWAPATASWAAPSRTRRSSSRATRPTTRPTSASTSRVDVTPGREVDGALVRRPVIFYNISYGVNAFADPARHEAAYLFLQWAGGARAYTFLTFNLGGYQDPHHIYTMTDPNVRRQLQAAAARASSRTSFRARLRRSRSRAAAPTATPQRGDPEGAHGTGSRPSRRPRRSSSAGTRSRTTQGVDIQVAALATYNTAFPTVVDTPGEQLAVDGRVDRRGRVHARGPAGGSRASG